MEATAWSMAEATYVSATQTTTSATLCPRPATQTHALMEVPVTPTRTPTRASALVDFMAGTVRKLGHTCAAQGLAGMGAHARRAATSTAAPALIGSLGDTVRLESQTPVPLAPVTTVALVSTTLANTSVTALQASLVGTVR